MTNTPTEIRQGDSYTWTDSHGDYLASASWTCKAYFAGASTLALTAVADGNDFDFTMTATQSAALSTGKYTVQIRFEKSGENHTPDGYTQTIEVLAGIATQTAGYEARTTARIILDQINSALQTLTVNPNLTVTIGAKSYTRDSLGELYAFKKKMEWEVKEEEGEERLAKGLGRKRILASFGNP